MKNEHKFLVIKIILIIVLIAILAFMALNNDKVREIAHIGDTNGTASIKKPDSAGKMYADEVAYLMNLRYTPSAYNDSVQKMCDSALNAVIENAIDKSTTMVENEGFINLNEQFETYGNNIIEEEDDNGNIVEFNNSEGFTDAAITEFNGNRGVYINDVYVKDNGKFDITICGNNIEVEVPDTILYHQMINNPTYLFKVYSYNYYDNGTLVVKLISDLDSAWEYHISNKMKIVDSVEFDGDCGTILDEIKQLSGDSQLKVTQDIYDAVKDYVLNELEYKEVTIECKVINDKISGISADIYKRL